MREAGGDGEVVVCLDGLAYVDEVSGGEEGLVASEHGLGEGDVFGELGLDEGVEEFQIFFGDGLACGECDEAAEEALCFLLGVLGFGLDAEVVKEDAV